MTETMWGGVGCLLLGGLTLVNWWFEMFSDCDYADLCRSVMESLGSGRNTIALVEPAIGMMLLFGGCGLLSDPDGSKDGPLQTFLVIGVLVSMAVFLLGLIPFRLPRWMYPDWQADKRWWRAERARLERKAEQARQAERAQQSQQTSTPNATQQAEQPEWPETAGLPHPTEQPQPPTNHLAPTPDLPDDDPPPRTRHSGRHRRESPRDIGYD